MEDGNVAAGSKLTVLQEGLQKEILPNIEAIVACVDR